MCTLTWRREGGSYEVFFNRDEKKTRSKAEPPRLREERGVRFLSPLDPDGGGTWMLANEHGVTVCLLNRWHEEGRTIILPSSSRGRLVWEMAPAENVPAAEEFLRSQDLSGLRPFSIVTFDQVGERGWDWNGEDLTPTKLIMPVCSSSFHFAEVSAARRSRFEDLKCSRESSRKLLEHYHLDTESGPSAFTVRMCRSDAQTMSRSHLTVKRGGIFWRYWEERPELAGEAELIETLLGPQTAVDPAATSSQGPVRQDDVAGGN